MQLSPCPPQMWAASPTPLPSTLMPRTSGLQLVAPQGSYQELVHACLTFLQVDAFDGHLLLPRLAVRCLDNCSGSAPCEQDQHRKGVTSLWELQGLLTAVGTIPPFELKLASKTEDWGHELHYATQRQSFIFLFEVISHIGSPRVQSDTIIRVIPLVKEHHPLQQLTELHALRANSR